MPETGRFQLLSPGLRAWTLVTPLFPLSPAQGHLLYRQPSGEIQRYVYRCGEALLFGDGFQHSTEPYAASSTLRVLLSLTLDSDHWQD